MYLFLLYILPKSFSLLCPTVPPGPLLILSTLSLKNPGAPRYLCTHPWGVPSYSPHGGESPSTYRIKRHLFRLGKKEQIWVYYKHTVLVTSGTALALRYLLKTSSVWWKNKFSLSLSKRNSNSWFSGWGDGRTQSSARLQKLLKSLPILENSTNPLFPGNFALQQINEPCWCLHAQRFLCPLDSTYSLWETRKTNAQ